MRVIKSAIYKWQLVTSTGYIDFWSI